MSTSSIPSPSRAVASMPRLPAGSLLEALTMWFSPPRVAVPGHLRGFTEYATARFGPPVLAVRNVDELDELLDELADDPAVEHLNQVVATDAKFFEVLNDTGEETKLSPPEQVISIVGAEQRPLVIEAERYLWAYISALQSATRGIVDRGDDLAAVAARGASPLDNPGVPAEVRLRMLAGVRAAIAMMAIVSAIIADKAIEPWLAHALCERWRDGLREYLALLASVPGFHISEDVMPLEARLDLPVLRADASEAYARDVARLRRIAGQ